jgi:hypothetical protein
MSSRLPLQIFRHGGFDSRPTRILRLGLEMRLSHAPKMRKAGGWQ